MLTQEQIEQNKQTFITLIESINREFDKEKLINWLTEKSDFFTAPASTKYHCAFDGGLCQHSLNVYYSLEALCNTFATEYKQEIVDGETKDSVSPKIDHDSIIITGLLHDLSKANFYEKYLRNVKNEQTGQWEKIPDFRVRPPQERLIHGNHEETAEYMVRSFIPLTPEESVAIMYHMGGKGWDSTQSDLSAIYGRYPLACLLHTADLLSTYCLENA